MEVPPTGKDAVANVSLSQFPSVSASDNAQNDALLPRSDFRPSQIVPIHDDGVQALPAQLQSLQPDGFCVVSLNIGGRNTNPLEFVMDGDDSDVGAEHASVMARI